MHFENRTAGVNQLLSNPRFALLLGLAAMAACVFVGCQSALPSYQDSLPVPPGPGTANYATNILQEGDVVSIMFQYSTNLNVVQKIQLDGTLNLEMVGPVKAAGKMPIELQAELTQLYKPHIKDDVITIKLVAASASIYISGAVFHPGKVPIERPMTVLEAIMEAGGFDPNRAKLSDTCVLRLENGRQRTYHINLKKILDGNEDMPFYLKPFDIIHVPTKTFNF